MLLPFFLRVGRGWDFFFLNDSLIKHSVHSTAFTHTLGSQVEEGIVVPGTSGTSNSWERFKNSRAKQRPVGASGKATGLT